MGANSTSSPWKPPPHSWRSRWRPAARADMTGAAWKAAALLAGIAVAAAAFAVTVEIKGRVTNAFPEDRMRSVVVIITDRLGVELGRARPDSRGQYELKITGPR